MIKVDGNIGESAISTTILDIGIEVMIFLPGRMCIEQSENIKSYSNFMYALKKSQAQGFHFY